MKREEYGETQRSGKHRKEWYLWFLIFLKQSEKEKKLTATNY